MMTALARLLRFSRSLTLRRLFLLFCCNAIAAFSLLSCTDPGLCYEPDHPHSGGVYFSYEWPEGFQLDTLNRDSMQVIAIRLINHNKYGMVVQSLSPNHGRYFYNPPGHVEQWIDSSKLPKPDTTRVDSGSIVVVTDPEEAHNGGIGPEPDPEPEDTTAIPEEPLTPYNTEVDHFRLANGTYKFFTMPTDTSEVVYTNIRDYLAAPGDGIQATDIRVAYRSYAANDSTLRQIGGGTWADYNPAFDFIQPNFHAIMVDSLDFTDIDVSHRRTLTFHPRPLTQNIDIYFTIRKDMTAVPFVIDDVWAEISGVPSRANLFNGHLYLAKTRKMRFNTEFVDASGQPKADSYSDDSVRVHANINVFTIMNAAGPQYATGPGILQLRIRAHAEQTAENGETVKRYTYLQAKTNLYRDLMRAKLITYDRDLQWATKSCDHAVLDLSTYYTIYGSSILNKSENIGGINVWVESGTDADQQLEL